MLKTMRTPFAKMPRYSNVKPADRLALQLATLSLGLLAMLLLTPAAQAQRGGFAAGGRMGPGGTHAGAARGRLVRINRGRRAYGGSAYGYGPNYYPFYDGEDGYAGEGEPPQLIMPNRPAAVALSQAPAPKPAESLVVELRGDHWVRLTGYGASEIPGQSPTFQAEGPRTGNASESATTANASHASELPPAVLVFRDGHQEEAAKYTIVGPTIFIKSNYWTSGSWTHKVAIASLDVPATLKLNQERGAKFSLPSRPGEVIMRP
jgi:hypothetical protein